MTIDAAFLEEQIAAIKAMITQYNAAILSLAQGAQSYTLNTGQTVQTVMRSQLGSLRATRRELYEELATLCARKGGGSTYVRPGW